MPINAKLLRDNTTRDTALSRVLHLALQGWPKQQKVPDNLKSENEVSVLDGCLLRGTRIVIPAKHQEPVLA